MISETELVIVRNLVQQLEQVQHFLINRENKNLLEILNTDDKVDFMDDSATVHSINKASIREAISFGKVMIGAEVEARIKR
jgi:hypothetical protein